jgi:hypothetical protein
VGRRHRSLFTFTSPIAATGAGTEFGVSITGKRQKTARTQKAGAPHNPKPTKPRTLHAIPLRCKFPLQRFNDSTIQRFNAQMLDLLPAGLFARVRPDKRSE